MRRHLVLIFVIAVVLAGVVFFRPERRNPMPIAGDPGLRLAVDSGSFKRASEATPSESSTIIPSTESSSSASLEGDKPAGPKGASLNKRYQATVSDEDGVPVEDATVIVFRTMNAWETYETTEAKTGKDGVVEITKTFREDVIGHVYKVDVGMATRFNLAQSDPSIRVPLRPSSRMQIRCSGKNGSLRGHAEFRVVAELNIGKRFLEPIWIRYPARRVVANEYGACEIEGLPNLGSSSDSKATMPGCRFTITATWEGRTAEVKFDDFPTTEVRIVLD